MYRDALNNYATHKPICNKIVEENIHGANVYFIVCFVKNGGVFRSSWLWTMLARPDFNFFFYENPQIMNKYNMFSCISK